MALLSLIRRWHHREGKSIRSISKQTGLSRNTIRKYLASGRLEPKYQSGKRTSKLVEYELTLVTWLHSEEKKPRKERKHAKQLHEQLITLGYTGSYDRVAAFVRCWKSEKLASGKGAYIPLVFKPGEAFQFDWSEEWAMIGGTRYKLQVAHIRLCYSRAFFMKAYRQQSHEMLFEAHAQGFRVLGGVPQRGIYDNMKTVVDQIGRGKDRTINRRFQAMASHYLFEPDFCTPAAGWEKGQVERQVQDVRHRIWQSLPEVDSLEQLNAQLESQCQLSWQSQHHPQETHRTVAEMLSEEQPCLMPMPPAFDGYIEHTKRVSSTSLITFERHKYSVPVTWANRMVYLRVYCDHIEIIQDNVLIAQHSRVMTTHDNTQPAKTVYDWRHYLGIIERKPGALRNGAPFQTWPESLLQAQRLLLKRPNGDRDMAHILALVLRHEESLVIEAVEMALKAQALSKDYVINCLQRLTQQPPAAPVDVPGELHLWQEPLANTAKYDSLREVVL